MLASARQLTTYASFWRFAKTFSRTLTTTAPLRRAVALLGAKLNGETRGRHAGPRERLQVDRVA